MEAIKGLLTFIAAVLLFIVFMEYWYNPGVEARRQASERNGRIGAMMIRNAAGR